MLRVPLPHTVPVRRHPWTRCRQSRTSALLLLVSLLACNSFAAEPLRLAVSVTPLSLPIYVAEHQGYFTAEGVTVKTAEVVGGQRAFQQLVDGTADLATCSEAVVMFGSINNRDFAVIATFVTSDDDLRVITRADTGITRAQQLAGRRVGTVVGSASHYYLDTLLLFNGVAPKAVQVVDLTPPAMADALRNRQVDAVAIWEPFAFAIQQSMAEAKTLPKSGAYVETFNLLAAGKTRQGREEDLVKVIRALDRAERFIRREPAAAQRILRDRLHVDQAFVDWVWPRYVFRLSLAQSLLSTLEAEARWARREGYVKAAKSPNYLDFIDAVPLRKVRPAAVGID